MSSQGNYITSAQAEGNGTYNGVFCSGNSWTDLGNLASEPSGSYAQCVGAGTVDNPLYMWSPILVIPTSATIIGVTVSISRMASAAGGSHNVKDELVCLLVNTPVGNNYAQTSTKWPTTAATAGYGSGTTDMWGLTTSSLNPTNCNSATGNFGVAVAQNSSQSGDTGYIGWCFITVYYNAPSGNSGGLTPIFSTSTVLCPPWNTSIGLYNPATGL